MFEWPFRNFSIVHWVQVDNQICLGLPLQLPTTYFPNPWFYSHTLPWILFLTSWKYEANSWAWVDVIDFLMQTYNAMHPMPMLNLQMLTQNEANCLLLTTIYYIKQGYFFSSYFVQCIVYLALLLESLQAKHVFQLNPTHFFSS